MSRSIALQLGGFILATLLGGCAHGPSSVSPSPTTLGFSQVSHDISDGVTADGFAAGSLAAAGFTASGFTYGGSRTADGAQACGSVDPTKARCLVSMRLDTPKLPGDAPPDSIPGFGPATLEAAYGLPSALFGFGQTIAVVIAHDDPVAGLDLARFRKNFGLPACTKSNGCYAKVNQAGFPFGYPTPDTDWAFGASVSLDVISGVCPNCHLLLVEANDFTETNMAAAVKTAVNLGADVVDITWGDTDFSQNAKYNFPGHIIVAPAADAGYGVKSFPAGSQYVVAVGATVLSRDSNSRGWIDKTWASTSSVCGPEPKPSWQHDSLCSQRMSVDVSAVGSPRPGVAVYDNYNEPGWMAAYETGVSAALVSGVYGLAANEGALNYARSLYVFRSRLNDVVNGDNGHCGGTYLCTAKPGYDGPTGNGTPWGVGAF